MEKIIQELNNSICRINNLIIQKNKEMDILEREVEILKKEKWNYEDLIQAAQENGE